MTLIRAAVSNPPFGRPAAEEACGEVSLALALEVRLMSSRQVLVPFLTVFSLVAPHVARAEDVKLAYVDLQRAFAEVDEGKTASARLAEMREAKQKELDKEQEALKKEKETFEKQMATMNDATRTQQGAELQRKVYELQQRFEKGRADLAQAQRDTLNAILSKMQPIITNIALRDGFTMVFEKTESGLLYAPASLDLTNDLIRLFNEKNKASKSPATPSKKSIPPTTK